MSYHIEDINDTENIEEVEELEPPKEQEQNLADVLSSKDLAKTVNKLIDEKLSLAEDAHDNEEEPEPEEVEETGIGLFPLLLIGGVVLIGASSLLLKNRPTTTLSNSETENAG